MEHLSLFFEGMRDGAFHPGVRSMLSYRPELFGGPFSVTGSVSETPGGDLSKSLRAGFKRTW